MSSGYQDFCKSKFMPILQNAVLKYFSSLTRLLPQVMIQKIMRITNLSDHRQFNHTWYEQLYQWLYCNHLKKGFMCITCAMFYGDIAC